jgi:cytochrome c553
LAFRNGYNRRLLFFAGERFMRFYLLTPLLLLTAGVLLADGDPAAGQVKSYTCTGCHGVPGYNNAYPNYKVPKVGGQNYEYLVAALQSYRDGQRQHATMQLQASSLSNQDIMDVSAYFAGLGNDQ